MNSPVDEDMTWEAAEIDKSLDFINVMFGALISAFLGVELAGAELSITDGVTVVALVILLAFSLYNLRSLLTSLVQNLESRGATSLQVLAILAGGIGVVSLSSILPINRPFLLTISAGWAVGAILISIGMVLRRWIKLHD